MAVERAASGSSLIDVLDRVLVEGFLSLSDISETVQFALDWLDRHHGVAQSLCLTQRLGEALLSVVGSRGLPTRGLANFTLSTDDWRNPLIHILTSRPHATYGS